MAETGRSYSQASTGAGQNTALVLLCLAVVVALFTRLPDVILHPQFFAEDGSIFYQQAHENGFSHSLLVSYAGYLHMFPRLIAGLSGLLSLAYAPLFFNATSLAIQCLPAIFLCISRMDKLGPLRARVLLAFLYLGVPHIADLWGTPTNAQWHLAILSFLILVAAPPSSVAWRVFDILALVLGALTGPFCILLLPVALLVFWKRRSPWTLKLIIILSLGAGAQIAALLLTGRPSGHTTLGASWPGFCNIMAYQVFLPVFPKADAIAGLADALSSALVLSALITIAGIVVMICIFARGSLEIRCLILFAALVLAASLASPLATHAGSQWKALQLPGNVSRYWYVPRLTIAAAALWLATAPVHKASRYIAIVGLALIMLADILNWRLPPRNDLHFKLYVEAFNALPIGSSLRIPIIPSGWAMRLTKNTHDRTSYVSGSSGALLITKEAWQRHFHAESAELFPDTLSGAIETVNGATVTDLGNPTRPMHITLASGALIEGWAATPDPLDTKPLDRLYTLQSDVLVPCERLPRPDISFYSKVPILIRSGFVVFLPPAALKPGLQAIRLIGYSQNDGKLYRYPQALYLYGN
jgi:hypothetical protein